MRMRILTAVAVYALLGAGAALAQTADGGAQNPNVGKTAAPSVTSRPDGSEADRIYNSTHGKPKVSRRLHHSIHHRHPPA